MRRINLRMEDALLARIDRARGLVPRNAYLVDLLERTTMAGQPSHPTGPPDNGSESSDARADSTAQTN